MNKILIVDNLLTQSLVDYIFSLTSSEKLESSKVGERIDKRQKIRRDFALSSQDCAPLDTYLLQSISSTVIKEFGIKLQYRERWKVGFYEGSARGHYNPHTDIQGNMDHRQLSFVIAMSDPAEYEGGELEFPEFDKILKPEKGTALIFPSKFLHGVRPVTAGERYTLLSFMFDEANGLKSGKNLANYKPHYLSIADPVIAPSISIVQYTANSAEEELDFAAGEEAFGPLPEHLEMQHDESSSLTFDINKRNENFDSDLNIEALDLNKQYLLPLTANSGPGNQLMGVKEALMMGEMLNRVVLLPPIHRPYISELKNWQFKEIYQYDKEDKAQPFHEHHKDHLGEKSFVLHGNFFEKRLKIEDVLNLNMTDLLLERRRFSNEEHYQELSQKKDRILCVKHLFNNTTLAKCGWNGCSECEINSALEPLYAEVCRNLDFSPNIKSHGDDFIQKYLPEDFLAVHLRYPDQMQGKTLKERAGYDEDDVKRILKSTCTKFDISEENIFIATNKQDLVKNSSLASYKVYRVSHENDIESFVEQYICCRSKVFLMSKFNDFAKIHEPHQRSTWSVAVADYRKYRLGVNSNLILQDQF